MVIEVLARADRHHQVTILRIRVERQHLVQLGLLDLADRQLDPDLVEVVGDDLRYLVVLRPAAGDVLQLPVEAAREAGLGQ